MLSKLHFILLYALFVMDVNMSINIYHGKKVASFQMSVVGGIGVAPIESEDDGFTARSAATYGITSHMVGIFCMRPPRHLAGLERFELSMPESNSGVLPITPQPIFQRWSVR